MNSYYNDTLQVVSDYLMRNNAAKLTIEGHSDKGWLELYNMFLSNRRAANVKAYLVEKLGIDPVRLTIRGVGSSQPIDDNENPEGRQRNRRVTISSCPEE